MRNCTKTARSPRFNLSSPQKVPNFSPHAAHLTFSSSARGHSCAKRSGFSRGDVARINLMYECTPSITGSGGSEDPKACVDTSNGLTCSSWVKTGYCLSNALAAYQHCCASCLAAAPKTLESASTTTKNPLCVDKSRICSILVRASGCDGSLGLRCCAYCDAGHRLPRQ